MKNRLTPQVAVLLLCCFVANASFADSPSEAYAARIEKLEALVASLEKRVSELEGNSSQKEAPAEARPDNAAWQDVANWRSLRNGMSKTQVRALLGEPAQIRANGSLETWRWPGPRFSTVTFRNEKVDGWNE